MANLIKHFFQRQNKTMKKSHNNFKDLTIEPVQSEKLKKHSKKPRENSNSPKKHHHKSKEKKDFLQKHQTKALDDAISYKPTKQIPQGGIKNDEKIEETHEKPDKPCEIPAQNNEIPPQNKEIPLENPQKPCDIPTNPAKTAANPEPLAKSSAKPEENSEKPAKSLKLPLKSAKTLIKRSKTLKKPPKIQTIANFQEIAQADFSNTLNNWRFFCILKLFFLVFLSPALIFLIIDAQNAYSSAKTAEISQKLAKIKVYGFYALVGLCAVFLLSATNFAHFRRKLNSFRYNLAFTLDFLASFATIFAFFTFFMLKLQDFTDIFEKYRDFLVKTTELFTFFAVTGVKAPKTQAFVAISLMIYAVFWKTLEETPQKLQKSEFLPYLLLTNALVCVLFSAIFKEKRPFSAVRPIFAENQAKHNEVLEKLAPKPQEIAKTLENIKEIEEKQENSHVCVEIPSKNQENCEKTPNWLEITEFLEEGVVIFAESLEKTLFFNNKMASFLGEKDNLQENRDNFETFLVKSTKSCKNLRIIDEEFAKFLQNSEKKLDFCSFCEKKQENLKMLDFFLEIRGFFKEISEKNAEIVDFLKKNKGNLEFFIEDRPFLLELRVFTLKPQEKPCFLLIFKEKPKENQENAQDSSDFSQNSGILADLLLPACKTLEFIEKLRENTNKNSVFSEDLAFLSHFSLEIYTKLVIFLDLSRISRGNLQIFAENYDLSAFLDELLRFLQPLVAKTGVKLQISKNFKAKSLIFADLSRLFAVLFTLLRNSLIISANSVTKTAKMRVFSEVSTKSWVFELEDCSGLRILENSQFFLEKPDILQEKGEDFSKSPTFLLKNSDFLWFSQVNALVSALKAVKFQVFSQENLGLVYHLVVSQEKNWQNHENIADSLLESDYVEKKNKNIAIFKENQANFDENSSILSRNSQFSEKNSMKNSQNREKLAFFPFFRKVLLHSQCFCANFLVISHNFQEIHAFLQILSRFGLRACVTAQKAGNFDSILAENPRNCRDCRRFRGLLLGFKENFEVSASFWQFSLIISVVSEKKCEIYAKNTVFIEQTAEIADILANNMHIFH